MDPDTLEDPPTNAPGRAEIERRRSGDLARPVARRPGPTAVYDTVTEGKTSWQFLRTRRWVGYGVLVVVFAIACVLLSQWQFGRGQQTIANNSIVRANFDAAAVPLETALPTLGAYYASQNWQRVSMTGTYLADDELVVRNRPHSGEVGFEVLTPLQLSDGSVFMVDRGWVASSADDTQTPASIPQPPTGTVDVVVRLRPSEAARGSATTSGNQISTIALSRVEQKIGGDLYTGAYGILDTSSPAPDEGLASIQTAAPQGDAATHYSYAGQWLLFAVVGFAALGLGIRREYRRLNSDDPEEQEREAERVRKRAKKAFTDEELEDEAIDGYIPMSRWGIGAGSAPARRAALPSARRDPAATGPSNQIGPSSEAPTVYVIYSTDDPDEDKSLPTPIE